MTSVPAVNERDETDVCHLIGDDTVAQFLAGWFLIACAWSTTVMKNSSLSLARHPLSTQPLRKLYTGSPSSSNFGGSNGIAGCSTSSAHTQRSDYVSCEVRKIVPALRSLPSKR